ncbi:hypothetical protein GLAREA_02071 [Glarea lozoyensis ATCC 20868]|uniref:Ecp2 effector protein domain-containing protein n=1 Tax=Glarea lozoyensis (strain ATCC 20868 / MF5171) TaxID=1116229 RepID=S3CLT3_GLAL2|nr:uncharacterized protein GLAREA_02071 [Glarea lozoyensis ATCC 20868]EPE26159.1 hypothetical protein GLAREA_02071 [Glarea lozoyensis ATCC 20868]
MHFRNLSVAALVSFITLAFTRPTAPTTDEIDNLPDGIYSITKYNNGTFSDIISLGTTESLAGSSVDIVAPAKTQALPNPETNCVSRSLNANDLRGARNGLNDWCERGNYLNPRTSVWVKNKSAQAYMCYYGTGTGPCHTWETDDAHALMDAACGSLNAAWVYINDWQKSYGRDTSGIAECGW